MNFLFIRKKIQYIHINTIKYINYVFYQLCWKISYWNVVQIFYFVCFFSFFAVFIPKFCPRCIVVTYLIISLWNFRNQSKFISYIFLSTFASMIIGLSWVIEMLKCSSNPLRVNIYYVVSCRCEDGWIGLSVL